MGIQIFWDNVNKDMTNSAKEFKAEMESYLKGLDKDFISNFRDAEDEYEKNDKRYPIENLEKAEEKFRSFFKEILNKDLASFIRTLPESQFGNMQVKLAKRKEILEGKTVEDLLESATLNRIAGTGAFQFGRGMEGLPKFNFFETELGEPATEIDMFIKQRKGTKGLEFSVTSQSGDNDDAEITITYPAKQEKNIIRDLKEAHLAKHGVFNPNFKATRGKAQVIEEGELIINLPQSILDRFIQNNRLIKDVMIQEVEVLEGENAVKGKSPYRTPTSQERAQVSAKYVELVSAKKRMNVMDTLVEIDGKTYAVKLGRANALNITPYVKKEVSELIASNDEKFKAALKPILDDPKIIAGATIELNIVTGINEIEPSVMVTRFTEDMDEKEIIETAEDLILDLKEEISIYRKYLGEDRETIKEMDDVYAKDYESYQKRREKLIAQKKTFSEKKELSDKEKDAVAKITQSINNASREMKAMLNDKKLVKERIKKYEEALEKRETLLNEIKDALKAKDLDRIQRLAIELEEPTVEITTERARLSAKRSATGLITFANRWKEGFPVLYQIKLDKMGEFDLNPFKRSKGPKSFDKDIFDGLKILINRINRINKVIR